MKMLMSKRHNKDLYYKGKIIIAPRFVIINETIFDSYTYYIHILKDCESVILWFKVNNTCLFKPNSNNVLYEGKYKLYFNSKGMYFNYIHWNKKIERVYICD